MEEIPQQSYVYGDPYGYSEQIGGDDIIWNQQNDLHVSIIKPITKKTIHCTETKLNAYYKPVEMVEEVNTYVAKGDESLLELYKEMQEKKKKETEELEKATKLVNSKSLMSKISLRNVLNKSGVYKKENDENAPTPVFKLFNEDEKLIPKVETVFVPRFEKNVELVTHLKENVNVDYTYMVPKPVVVPVEVPVLKYKDNFQIVPIRKKIIPVVKYTDETIYVDCFIEKPYLVVENIVIPVPCDAPIGVKKYLHKAPPLTREKKMDTREEEQKMEEVDTRISDNNE